MTNYIVHRVTTVDGRLASFYLDEVETISKYAGNALDGRNFRFISYAKEHLVWVAKKKDEIVGVMLARLYRSILDPSKTILFQDLLYVKRGNSKAAYMLFKQFIDFGKLNADHVFTSTHEQTNIKQRSLERLGFKKIQEQYRLEIK